MDLSQDHHAFQASSFRGAVQVGRGLLLDSHLVEGSGAEETTIAFRPCSDRNLALTLSTPSCNVIRVPHGDW